MESLAYSNELQVKFSTKSAMYKLKRARSKMLPCGTPKLLSLMDKLLSSVEQIDFVLGDSYELVLKLTHTNLTCEAFPITLGDRLRQVPWNSQVEFQR